MQSVRIITARKFGLHKNQVHWVFIILRNFFNEKNFLKLFKTMNIISSFLKRKVF